MRVGLWLGDDYCPVDAEMLAGIERAGQALASQGATVNEAKPDFSLAEHHETYLMHLSPIIGASFGPDEIALMERVALTWDLTISLITRFRRGVPYCLIVVATLE